MTALSELQDVASRIVEGADVPEDKDHFYRIFLQASRVGGASGFRENEAFTSSGIALTPSDAMECVLDWERTKVFIRGLRQMVLDLYKIKKEPIHVCEVGSGPFAPLVTTTAALLPREMVFSCYDFFQTSLDSVNRSLAFLGMSDRLIYSRQGDATYSLNFRPVPDLFVVECMDRALLAEPQAAIFANLSRSFPSAQFLPASISVNGITDSSRFEVVNLDASFSARLREATYRERKKLLTVRSPWVKLDSRGGVTLDTRVTVFGAHVLEPKASQITGEVHIKPPFVEPHGDVRFSYEMGQRQEEIRWERRI